MSANIAKINLLHKEAYKKNILKDNSVCMNNHSPENVNGHNGKSILYELEYKIKNNKNKEFITTKDLRSLATSNKKSDEFKLSQKLKETLVNDIMNKSIVTKRNDRQDTKKDNIDNIKIMNNLTYELNSIVSSKDKEQNSYQFQNENNNEENSLNASMSRYNKDHNINDDPTSTFYTRLLDNLNLDERQSQKYLEKMNQE
jgi:hypothetical protein